MSKIKSLPIIASLIFSSCSIKKNDQQTKSQFKLKLMKEKAPFLLVCHPKDSNSKKLRILFDPSAKAAVNQSKKCLQILHAYDLKPKKTKMHLAGGVRGSKILASGQHKDMYEALNKEGDSLDFIFLAFKKNQYDQTYVEPEIKYAQIAGIKEIGPKLIAFREIKDDKNYSAELVLEKFDGDLDGDEKLINDFRNFDLSQDISKKFRLFSDSTGLILADMKAGNILVKKREGVKKISITDFDPRFILNKEEVKDTKFSDNPSKFGTYAPDFYIDRSKGASENGRFNQKERNYLLSWYDLYSQTVVLTQSAYRNELYKAYAKKSSLNQRIFVDLENMTGQMVGNPKKYLSSLSNQQVQSIKKSLEDLKDDFEEMKKSLPE